MRSTYLAIVLLINYVCAIPGIGNYVAPSNSTRVGRQTETSEKNIEDVLAQRKDDSDDAGPLGEVQLDVEEEDIGEAAVPKMRVRRGYSQPKSKYGGGQSSKYEAPKPPPPPKSKYGGESSPKYY